MLLDGQHDKAVPDRMRAASAPVYVCREPLGKETLRNVCRVEDEADQVGEDGWPDWIYQHSAGYVS